MFVCCVVLGFKFSVLPKSNCFFPLFPGALLWFVCWYDFLELKEHQARKTYLPFGFSGAHRKAERWYGPCRVMVVGFSGSAVPFLRLCDVWSVGSSVCSMLEWLVGGGGVAEVDGLVGLAKVFGTTLGS